MKRFYFFESKRVRNEQGEMRVELYPLPGQTTGSSAARCAGRVIPVDTAMRVQVSVADRAFLISRPVGTRFGCAITGTTIHSVRLPVYSRNGSGTYRADDIRAVTYYGTVAEDRQPDGEMLEAYEHLVASIESDRAPQPGESAPAASRQSAASLDGMVDFPVLPSNRLMSSRAEIDRIKNHFDRNGGAASIRLFGISRLIDLMQTSVVRFRYRKANGDLRTAYGTRCGAIISRFDGSVMDREASERTPDGSQVRYFDTQRRAWRCFCSVDFDELLINPDDGHCAILERITPEYINIMRSTPVIGG